MESDGRKSDGRESACIEMGSDVRIVTGRARGRVGVGGILWERFSR
jgi:hypothetical protein